MEELEFEFLGDTGSESLREPVEESNSFDSDEFIESINFDDESLLVEEPFQTIISYDDSELLLRLDSLESSLHNDLFLILAVALIAFARSCLAGWRSSARKAGKQ